MRFPLVPHPSGMTHVHARAAIVGMRPAVPEGFELAKLADLHSRGVITDAEFEQRKEKLQG